MVHRSDRRVRIGFPFAIGRQGFPDDRLAAGCGFRPAAIVSAGPICIRRQKAARGKTGLLFHARPEYWCGSVPYRLGKLPRIPDLCRANEKNGFPTMSVRPCEILNCGDVYLFPETNSRCQGRSSLWSVIVLRKRNVVLESDTGDYRHFAMWRPLAVGCRYCRLAKRSEFRDYRVNLTYAEMRKIG